MCYIYLTIRIIIVGKMKASKRMELAKIILKKVTQAQRDKVHTFYLICLSSSSFVLCINLEHKGKTGKEKVTLWG